MRLLTFISLILLFSCSQRELNRRAAPETTSTIIDIENSDDNSLISPEEKRRQAVLEYYRKLREEDQKTSTNKYSARPPIQRQKVIQKKVYRPVDEKDQFVEIEQHSIFFCMDKKSATQFNSADDCKVYTQNLITKCQNEYDQGDPRLTNCVKSGLR